MTKVPSVIVEIAGTSTENKGAELMLRAVLDALSGCPEVTPVVRSNFGNALERGRYGLGLLADIRRWGRSRLCLKFMPTGMRQMLGIVLEHEVAVMLDASGFAFGQPHPVSRCEEFVRQIKRLKSQGGKVILLPQAFGASKDRRMGRCLREILENSDLVYARDDVSFNVLKEHTKDWKKLRLAPDFTIAVGQGEKSAAPWESHSVAIVPNARMLEFAPSVAAGNIYLKNLLTVYKYCIDSGLEPFFLVHSKPDKALLDNLQKQSSIPISITEEVDPLAIKKLLGQCRLVVASRFHAIVSALTRNVPVIATTWSHKYEQIMSDYESVDTLIDAYCINSDKLLHLIGLVLDRDYEERCHRIRQTNDRVRAQVLAMWSEVLEVTELCQKPEPK